MTRSSHTYTGEPIRYASNTFQTGLQVLVVPKDLLDTVLAACRKQKGRLTGLLNQLVVRALSESLPQEMGFDSFTGQIVIDLRPLVPDYSDNMMGNYVSAICDISPRIGAEADYDHTFWEAVRNTTFQLADAVSTLEDQPIGLLKYLNNFRSWFLNQIGKDRDLSYEISNVGVFDPSVRGECGDVVPSTPEGQIRWKIERIMFSQPANVTGAPLNFQAATMKDADLVITLNWQIGVLGVQDEDTLTRTILNKIQGFMDEIAMKYASPYS
ncbi:hypothetical protein BDV59DRAFT_176049, partial [Aspergillus ambiguus]|uniref:uncharacterized protein n=1 Tax=Aspergillus ambiguus TaxID=176160 RepID=UPI003CCCC958